jgi:hypothetical protein
VKVTILACDWCKLHKNAVATLQLTNGRVTKSAPTLDLCKPHMNELHKLFQSRKRKVRGPDKQPRRQGRKPFVGVKDKLYVPIVMKLATKQEKFGGRDVRDVTKLSPWNARELLGVMVKAGQIKRHGKGRGAYWTKA